MHGTRLLNDRGYDLDQQFAILLYFKDLIVTSKNLRPMLQTIATQLYTDVRCLAIAHSATSTYSAIMLRQYKEQYISTHYNLFKYVHLSALSIRQWNNIMNSIELKQLTTYQKAYFTPHGTFFFAVRQFPKFFEQPSHSQLSRPLPQERSDINDAPSYSVVFVDSDVDQRFARFRSSDAQQDSDDNGLANTVSTAWDTNPSQQHSSSSQPSQMVNEADLFVDPQLFIDV